MTRPGPLSRFRLIDGVIVAAVALLGLKVLGFVAGEGDTGSVRRTAVEEEPFGRLVAHARTNYEPPADPTTTGSVAAKAEEPPPEKEPPAPRDTGPAPSLLPPSASEQALLSRLGDRREELQQRSREMEAREKLIQEQERKLDERLGDEKAREDAKAGKTETAEGGALKGLITMYETMKPKEAARVFDRLPLEILVSVVSQMNPRKMSEILAAMTPESAEKLTIALARKGKADGPGRAAGMSATLPAGELQAIDPPTARR